MDAQGGGRGTEKGREADSVLIMFISIVREDSQIIKKV